MKIKYSVIQFFSSCCYSILTRKNLGVICTLLLDTLRKINLKHKVGLVLCYVLHINLLTKFSKGLQIVSFISLLQRLRIGDVRQH